MRRMRFARHHGTVALIGGWLAIVSLVGACSSAHKASSPTTTATPSIGGTTAPTASTVPPPSGPPASTTNNGIALGVYVPSDVAGFDQQLGRAPAIIQSFFNWEAADGSPVSFPMGFVKNTASQGALPMITWQPGQAGVTNGATTANATAQPSFTLNALASGVHDSYIQQWAESAKSWGRPVYVRLIHEMNLHGYPWALGVNGNTSAAQYIAAWRHIVGIFRQVGATNVQFVWCVGSGSAAEDAEDPSLYPGDAWVQWVAIDGYNRNQTAWRTLSSIFGSRYAELTSFSHRPVMIAETGSIEETSQPDAKAQWITSGFLDQIPQQFPRVKAALYFDSTGSGFTYPLTSSAQAFAAFKSVASNPIYDATAPTQPLSY